MRASRAAELLDSELMGGSDPEITGVAPLDRAEPHQLAFLVRARYLPQFRQSRAGVFLIARDLAERVSSDRPTILVPDVYRALSVLLPHLYPEEAVEPGIHETALVSPDATLGTAVTVAGYAVIGPGARIGDRVRIGPHAVVGPGCELGDHVELRGHVVLERDVRVGARTLIHAGARLGVDGFGYADTPEGRRKIPQVGGCVIGEDVEIGANTTIDRGSVGATEIGDGVKIDNQVHVAHNVRIGAGAVIVAQVGIAGSSSVGAGATLAGQAGVVDHVHIGADATIASASAVWSDVPEGAVYSGIPARPHAESLRAHARLRRLDDLERRLRALEGREAAGSGDG